MPYTYAHLPVEERLTLVSAPDLQEEALAVFTCDPSSRVRRVARLHPNATPEMVRTAYTKSVWDHERQEVLAHPGCPPDLIARFGSRVSRQQALPYTPFEEQFEQLIQELSAEQALALAKNRALTLTQAQTLLRLIGETQHVMDDLERQPLYARQRWQAARAALLKRGDFPSTFHAEVTSQEQAFHHLYVTAREYLYKQPPRAFDEVEQLALRLSTEPFSLPELHAVAGKLPFLWPNQEVISALLMQSEGDEELFKSCVRHATAAQIVGELLRLPRMTDALLNYRLKTLAVRIVKHRDGGNIRQGAEELAHLCKGLLASSEAARYPRSTHLATALLHPARLMSRYQGVEKAVGGLRLRSPQRDDQARQDDAFLLSFFEVLWSRCLDARQVAETYGVMLLDLAGSLAPLTLERQVADRLLPCIVQGAVDHYLAEQEAVGRELLPYFGPRKTGGEILRAWLVASGPSIFRDVPERHTALLLELTHRFPPSTRAWVVLAALEEWADVPPDVLHAFSTLPEAIRADLIRRRGGKNSRLLQHLLDSPTDSERALASAILDLTPEQWQMLAGDPKTAVRSALAGRDDVPLPILDRLLVDVEGTVRNRAARHPRLGETSGRLEALARTADPQLLLGIAGNPSTPLHLLTVLARHPDPEVRMELLSRDSDDHMEVVRLLAKDTDREIQAMAQTLLADMGCDENLR